MERLEAGRSHISIYRRSACVLQPAQDKSRLTAPSSGSEGALAAGTPVTRLAAGTEAAPSQTSPATASQSVMGSNLVRE